MEFATMTLYTVFFEYLGGIHIRQLAAAAPEEAVRKAAPSLSADLGASAKALAEAMEDCDIEALPEYENIWTMAASLDDTLLLAHVIATSR
jgi:hypothetical protein